MTRPTRYAVARSYGPHNGSGVVALSGRKPVPRRVRELRGNPRHHPLPDEPDVPTGLPGPPPELSPTARREWFRVGRQLLAAGLVTKLDRASLTLYCEAWDDYLRAVAYLAEHGPTIVTRFGDVTLSPFVKLKGEAWARVERITHVFGMNPSARTRLGPTTPKDEVDPVAVFQQRRPTTRPA